MMRRQALSPDSLLLASGIHKIGKAAGEPVYLN